MMRIGVATANARVDGALVVVNLEVSGDREDDVPVWCLHGTRYDPASLTKGTHFLVLPHDGPKGDHVAIPGGYLNASATSEPVALRSDVEAVDARLTAIDQKLATHAHSTGGPPVGYVLTDAADIAGSDPFEVTQ